MCRSEIVDNRDTFYMFDVTSHGTGELGRLRWERERHGARSDSYDIEIFIEMKRHTT